MNLAAIMKSYTNVEQLLKEHAKSFMIKLSRDWKSVLPEIVLKNSTLSILEIIESLNWKRP